METKKNIDWNEEVIINPSTDYYMYRWLYMCEHIRRSSIWAAIISVVIAILMSNMSKGGAAASIIMFIPNLLAVFIVILPIVLFYQLSFKEGKSSSFIIDAVMKLVGSIFRSMWNAFTGGGFRLALAIISLGIAAVKMAIAIPLLLFLVVSAPTTLLFYAVMYLIDKKANITEEKGRLLDNIINVVSIVIVCVILGIAIK